jgi:hypothetical protein
VGKLVGGWVGERVVGVAVGVRVGNLVGVLVGANVGAAVGTSVQAKHNAGQLRGTWTNEQSHSKRLHTAGSSTPEHDRVGATVGASDAAVGANVGAAVGANVGAVGDSVLCTGASVGATVDGDDVVVGWVGAAVVVNSLHDESRHVAGHTIGTRLVHGRLSSPRSSTSTR